MVAVEPGPTRNRSRLAVVVVQSSDALIGEFVSVTLIDDVLETVPVELTVPVKVELVASDVAAVASAAVMTTTATISERRTAVIRRDCAAPSRRVVPALTPHTSVLSGRELGQSGCACPACRPTSECPQECFVNVPLEPVRLLYGRPESASSSAQAPGEAADPSPMRQLHRFSAVALIAACICAGAAGSAAATQPGARSAELPLASGPRA